MGEAVISLIDSNGVNTTYTLDKNSLSVGRNKNCDIQINNTSVSGLHGRFHWAEGSVYYTDLNSTNGSYIKGFRLSSQETILSDGTVIHIAGANAPIQLTITLLCRAKDSPDDFFNQTVVLSDKFGFSDLKVITIGRDPSCDIVLPQINASRFHARVHVRDNGVYMEDGGSTNGTFVNGVRITKPCKISDSDTIHIAGMSFRLENGVFAANDSQYGLPVYVSRLYRRVLEKGAEKILLDNINITIEPNEFVAIMGGSGAGKSTLMNVLCGKTGTYEGEVAFDRSGTDSRVAYKSVIGFAPQHDILYDDLTLWHLLLYSAKLKMPGDTRPEEYTRRVEDAIRKVQLEGHENTLIGQLSGGQRKRASIAIELLSNPRLFFLDEPTSGLDPSTERDLMRMLKNMAADKKTIVAVTHITQNISLCDKLIILGRGGKLCFFGTPANACAFFGVSDFVDIYDKINADPDKWQKKFAATYGGEQSTTPLSYKKRLHPASQNSGWRQFLILSARYMKLISCDVKRLLLLLLQAPVLGLLLMLVSASSSDEGVFAYSSTAKSMLFSLTCAAFWVGMLNSIQEICKERPIYAREQLSTVRMMPYIASKLAVIAMLSVLQSFALVLVMSLFSGGLPTNDFGILPFLGFFLTAYLTTFCAACLGLAISALSPNPDRAMAIAPLLLLPQILFSGVVFELTGFLNFISNIVPCKLSVQNFGVLSDFNALPTSAKIAEKSLNAVYSVTDSVNLYGSWIGLIALASLYVVIFILALKIKEI